MAEQHSFQRLFRADYDFLVSQLTASNDIKLKPVDDVEIIFEAKTPLGKVEGTFGYLEPILKVSVTKKPLLVPFSTLFKELEKQIKPYLK